MSEKKNYSASSLEELLAEAKKVKKMNVLSSFIIGFLVGVMVYGVAKKGFGFLHIFIPAILIIGIVRYSQTFKSNLKEIQAEINARDSK